MVVCGVEEAVRILELCGARAACLAPSGTDALVGMPLLEASGCAGALVRCIGGGRPRKR